MIAIIFLILTAVAGITAVVSLILSIWINIWFLKIAMTALIVGIVSFVIALFVDDR